MGVKSVEQFRQELSADVPVGCVAVWALGQAGFVVREAHATIVFDPYLTDVIQSAALGPRSFPPPLSPDELAHVDLLFITHDHSDHLDAGSALPILAASPGARAVAPGLSGRRLRELGVDAERIVVPPLDDEIVLGGVRVRAIPAAHYTPEPDEEGQPRFLSYLVTLGGITVYHSGDTIMYDGMLERLRRRHVDLAILPINGRDWPREQHDIVGNLTVSEAAFVADKIGAGLLVPCHFDLFPGNAGDTAALINHLRTHYPNQPFKIMVPGERIVVAA